MEEYDTTRFVYSSSATVYGTPPVIPIPESTRLQADSPYGKTKVMSETIISDLCAGQFTWLYSTGCPQSNVFLIDTTAEPNRWRALSLRYFK